ncbi:UNVERIFIED_ORG: sodium/proton antiporter (NhaD family) [Idiomarina abyssalis]|jgi:NhaD family Na+/H+ antiporter|uniref:sodium:proton antiporter NhaD n=1 Tax=Idiomarina TaxID=135575 RepID=UPI000C6237E1|nr:MULTISPECIES: sodium:proton antiporter NhaD [Idiomarina]MAA61474.1 sodium:proton antiporter [Idiomarina sp.]PWW40458.1 sodium/proton antiporter (NhaD family) [Idiomarina loihiensis]TDO48093.1 sodium/proton antiporter (NhaD family) [Idiomarina sp. 017G]TDP50149.1 sodium/proton antiporter (NhaD family) [Idiomarina loihiensis]TDS24499.1 sodium/proton antiporter (NhaD family) [Idiomarina sp. H2]|tara:strand:+ start:9484 stop:10917 length:1434 start_codon:yes stop_codon:yes gene_type:complete
MKKLLFTVISLLFSVSVLAAEPSADRIDLTSSTVGYAAIVIFILAYILVMGEEKLHMRKSKPVLVAAGVIWILIGFVYSGDNAVLAEEAFRENLLKFAELMLFLLVAMTYINALEERRLFDALSAWLMKKGFTYRKLFWITGFLAFFISPIADNLTTALLMSAVVMKVAEGNKKFVALCCSSIVIAVNAAGAFSPFGDITTLMVWQSGKVEFTEFLQLFVPALVNYLIPAVIMSFFIENKSPTTLHTEVELKRGALRITFLFLLTVATAVACHIWLHLPPVLGMMMGLGYLQFFGYFLRMTLPGSLARKRAMAEREGDQKRLQQLGGVVPFDVFSRVSRAEWDTLLFFYGIVLCVGGLGFMGYLGLLSESLYGGLDPTIANSILGVVSALVDNIPVMFAVLSMDPEMSTGHWLLITLACCTGGSLLSIGSASGVALMGQARGYYTFMSHLKWTPVIAIGYAASILLHLWLNQATFLS